MDLVQELRRKVKSVSGHPRFDGFSAAIRHVEVAERYLQRARQEEDFDAYNDVIYRMNQAFEGMLKEAFTVFSGKDAAKLSPFEIEQRLLKDKKLPERVLALFKNYRQDWRNISRHDHTILFSDQEALLAIVNVAAFAVVLIDLVTEAITHQKQLQAAESRVESIRNSISGYSKRSFDEQVIALLKRFSVELSEEETSIQSEIELLGHLTGFITAVEPTIPIVRDTVLGDTRYRGDLLLEKDGRKVLIEVKFGRSALKYTEPASEQVSTYLAASGINTGILFIPPFPSGGEVQARKLAAGFSGKEVWIVAPELRKGASNA